MPAGCEVAGTIMEKRMGRNFRSVAELVVVVGILAWGAGCGGVPLLPASFGVATSATDRVTAEAGSGPVGLADSTWSLARLADPDSPESDGSEPTDDADAPPGPYGGLLNGRGLDRPPVGERMFLAFFGPQGVFTGITENSFFLTEFYGSEIPIGGDWNATTLPGVAFRSESYGVQVEERFGLAVVAHVRFGNLFLGRAVLYAWGTIDDDRLNGTFGYVLDFTDGLLKPLGTIADQYPVEGQRVEP